MDAATRRRGNNPNSSSSSSSSSSSPSSSLFLRPYQTLLLFNGREEDGGGGGGGGGGLGVLGDPRSSSMGLGLGGDNRISLSSDLNFGYASTHGSDHSAMSVNTNNVVGPSSSTLMPERSVPLGVDSHLSSSSVSAALNLFSEMGATGGGFLHIYISFSLIYLIYVVNPISSKSS